MEEMIEEFLYDKVIHYLIEFNECEEKSIDKIIEYFNFIKLEWEAFVYRDDVEERTFAGVDGTLLLAHTMGEAIFDFKPDMKLYYENEPSMLVEDLYKILIEYKDSEFMKKNLNDYEMRKIRTDFE